MPKKRKFFEKSRFSYFLNENLCYHSSMLKLIDFYADWCGPCKVMEPIFEELEKDYTGKIEFTRLDVETEGEKAAKFGVQGIPTFVITKDDKEIDRKVGAMPKEILKRWLDSHVK